VGTRGSGHWRWPDRKVRAVHISPDRGSHRPFSRINAELRAAGRPEIDWQIPDA